MKEKTFYTIINTCIVIGFIIAVLTAVSLIHQVTSPTANDTRYITQAKVISADTTTDTVQIEDTHGEVWEFFGVNDFQESDSVIVLMDNQKTSTKYDDEILSVRLDPFAN